MRRILLLLLLFCLESLAWGGAWGVAARAEVIRIDDVEVEISAANPVEARERAFLEARRTGYRLALEAAGQTVPARISDEAVNAAVVAIEVRSERQSADRYSARFSLFVEAPGGASTSPGQSSPGQSSPAQRSPAPSPAGEASAKRGAWIYVIPAERAEGRIDRIWRRDTAWTQSFRAVGAIAGQSPLTPSGDEDDRALVAPARLAANDAGALAALSQRHGAPVAAAILDRGPPTRAGRSDGPVLAVEVLYWSRPTGSNQGGARSLRHVFADKTEITTANAIAQALLEQIISPISPTAPAPPIPPLAAEASAPPPPASPPAPALFDPPPAPPPFAPPPFASPEKPVGEPVAEIAQPFAFDVADADEWRRLRTTLAAIPGLTVWPSTVTTGRIIGQLRYAGPAEILSSQLAAAGLAKGAPRPPELARSIAPPPPPPPPVVQTPPGAPNPSSETAFPAAGTEAELAGYAAHLVSTRLEAEAREEWSRLSQRFPDLLSGRAPLYRSVDLGADRGIWWRLGVAGFATRREADAWCAKLAAFNQYCRVAAN